MVFWFGSLLFRPQEKVGNWRKPGDRYARIGSTTDDPGERMLRGEEDPFYDKMKGKTYRGYYDYIILKGGRSKDAWKQFCVS